MKIIYNSFNVPRAILAGVTGGLDISLDPDEIYDPDVYLSLDGSKEFLFDFTATENEKLLDFLSSLKKSLNEEQLEETRLVFSKAKELGFFAWLDQVDDSDDFDDNDRKNKSLIQTFSF